MAYEVITTSFRSDLHARWSAVFDRLQVPWVYEPHTFTADDGRNCVPAFWLPRERIWFDAVTATEREDLGWWRRFAAAARGWEYFSDDWFDEPDWDSPVQVDEVWHGTALLAIGPLPRLHGNDALDLWQNSPEGGMWVYDDAMYWWTLCPVCGLFGAEYFGQAERLPCECLNDREHNKTRNGHDARLLKAYQDGWNEAVEEVPAVTGAKPAGHPWRRRALIPQQGAAEATLRCVAQCRSVAEVLRGELPEEAYVDAEEAHQLCDSCPGFVCTGCGAEPAAAPGEYCRSCEPVPLLSDAHARDQLNLRAIELSRLHKEQLKIIHPVINKAMGVRRRGHATLADLAVGLTQAEHWLAHPGSLQIPNPTLSEEEIDMLSGAEVRQETAARVGTLSAVVHDPIPIVQMRINNAMGVRTRAEADEEQLRSGLRQVRQWLHTPASYHEAG
ncbi:hypothetical protein F7Q99_36945 [Streptomyces kaniharaensis]|uniref:Uncharacterized protein n=1 Tax=Streptomyces kaniharaensis TaxID=212423 RepID=A0A6N7L1K4_9ACTN|nr:hypothetical protein [Streptomyces kaniharaensis]MQS17630.1 hypothetical protein [Streptomyces kaniharaensis]